MGNVTLTPNIGLQVPAVNQANWEVPLNYDLNLLDAILGGTIPFPLPYAAAIVGALSGLFVTEQATESGSNTFTLSNTPLLILAVLYNGTTLVPPGGGANGYTLSGQTITLGFSTMPGDVVYAVYFKS